MDVRLDDNFAEAVSLTPLKDGLNRIYGLPSDNPAKQKNPGNDFPKLHQFCFKGGLSKQMCLLGAFWQCSPKWFLQKIALPGRLGQLGAWVSWAPWVSWRLGGAEQGPWR